MTKKSDTSLKKKKVKVMLSGVADPNIDDGWEKESLQMIHYYFDTQKKSTFRQIITNNSIRSLSI